MALASVTPAGHGESPSVQFGRRLCKTILERARRYRHRSNLDLAPRGGAHDRPLTKGEQIRQRIADNARRRLAIAEAMKAEAGVRDHTLTGERDGGLAWSQRQAILAPAGENAVQLATLAHECGHIFLHAPGTQGFELPSHVKEMEAEAYAHQAFRAHGVKMPRTVTQFGRDYVWEWIAADRASGIEIDPRALAYALGHRSPYEPLRCVPGTWLEAGRRSTDALSPVAEVALDLDVPYVHKAWRSLRRWVGRMITAPARVVAAFRQRLCDLQRNRRMEPQQWRSAAERERRRVAAAAVRQPEVEAQERTASFPADAILDVARIICIGCLWAMAAAIPVVFNPDKQMLPGSLPTEVVLCWVLPWGAVGAALASTGLMRRRMTGVPHVVTRVEVLLVFTLLISLLSVPSAWHVSALRGVGLLPTPAVVPIAKPPGQVMPVTTPLESLAIDAPKAETRSASAVHNKQSRKAAIRRKRKDR